MNDIMDKPFCACSTPGGASGIAVIRLSGANSSLVADKVIKIIRSSGDYKSVSEMPGYTCAFAHVIDSATNQDIDDVVVTRFVPPYSYTGEELVEISCHGGSCVKQEILRVLIEAGARVAEPGEFTKRAFLNGKLDLSQAEAVMNVIAADSGRALKASNSQLNGNLRKELDESEKRLYEALSLIEMIVEFPEHDDTPENTAHVLEILEEVKSRLNVLANSYQKGRVLSERMSIALSGLPNSGKSSLLNALSGYDRAIVTEVAGTTRDTLEVQISVDGIPVTIVDTAGIRETSDRIEAMGVERAIMATSESDIVFYLVAPESSDSEIISQIETLLNEGVSPEIVTIVFSKRDIGANSGEDKIMERCNELGIRNSIKISSMETISINELKEYIVSTYENLGGNTSSEIIIMNKRHAQIIMAAIEYMHMSISAINDELGVDIASSVIRSALEQLGEITGKRVSSELVDSIFSRFCIGK